MKLPDVEKIIKRLKLINGAWGVVYGGHVFTFPVEFTREMAEERLRAKGLEQDN
jgi:hypothetical protein